MPKKCLSGPCCALSRRVTSTDKLLLCLSWLTSTLRQLNMTRSRTGQRLQRRPSKRSEQFRMLPLHSGYVARVSLTQRCSPQKPAPTLQGRRCERRPHRSSCTRVSVRLSPPAMRHPRTCLLRHTSRLGTSMWPWIKQTRHRHCSRSWITPWALQRRSTPLLKCSRRRARPSTPSAQPKTLSSSSRRTMTRRVQRCLGILSTSSRRRPRRRVVK
mmetsp:Transcript_30719/g.41240  ORF Transcript_30719/g.41240 Transcript_30719/m.41240 type:complete len:214 (-) Transcript_30719:41-682(-)